MLKGPRGTEVDIRILRKGVEELLPFTIKRDKIPIFSVDVSYMINDDIGYIKINRFSMTTYDEFIEGLVELKEMGMKKLILDLRGNVGGVMDASTRIVDEFLKEGKLIVYTEGRARPRDEILATPRGTFLEGELVILQDQWSASASEIVAGAIQDNDRGTIIGRRSFGKGLVQEPVMFNDGSAMRLTIARYYTPTGRSIQKPYDNGYDDYYAEMGQRIAGGELNDVDNFQIVDSVEFVTPGGKVVYGGGGIMPDVFIPIDTTGFSNYFMRIRAAGLIYRFALKYTDDNRSTLQNYDNAKDLESYLDNQSLMDDFIRFASNNGVVSNEYGIRASGLLIHTQLKAYIARNIIDNEGFYPIWHQLDVTLLGAIDYLRDSL
jgi:carboxyl-terminal processing protease